MKLSLGFSPCPNDTFIFDALVNRKIDTGDFDFEVVLEDIQTLNHWAAEGRLDITKLSFPAFFQNQDQYQMLDAGAALGKGVGPLLVAKRMVQVPDIEKSSIAIPGENTTANFLLNFAFPMAKNKTSLLFSEIEDAVVMEKFDLGVIIHENRFTYHQKGLIKVCDLGEIWEQRQNAPIPLACIAAKTSVGEATRKKLTELIRQSVEYAFKFYPQITDFTREHSQAMEEEVMRKHIELYVNNYSIDLGDDGKKAIAQLFNVYKEGRTEKMATR
ncbi:MAG: 1,4-dihydroxy-6-naphthoate synthase [Flavisolibacter sp.]